MNKVITKEDYLNAVEIVAQYHLQLMGLILEAKRSDEFLFESKCNIVFHMPLVDVKLSIRAYNILKNWDEKIGLGRLSNATTADLHKIKYKVLRRCRNVGSKTLQEIEALCLKYGQKMDYESEN